MQKGQPMWLAFLLWNPMSEEARKHPRQPFEALVEVHLPDGDKIAVAGNVSPGGVLVRSDRKVDLGVRVDLKIRFNGDREDLQVTGKVVRVEDELGDAAQLWPFRLGVEFDESIKLDD